MKKCNCGFTTDSEYEYDNHIYSCKEYKNFNRKILIFIALFVAAVIFIILIQ